MKYKIVRIANFYKEYIDYYYQNYSNHILGSDYNTQYAHLLNNSCELYSYFSTNFKKIGVESFDIISNATLLQDAWKKENNCDLLGKDLILFQLQFIKPDILWIDDTSLLSDYKWINSLKTFVPSIKIITGQFCAPYNSILINSFRALDFIFTCTPGLKKEFEDLGIKTYLNYHSFEKSILNKIETSANERKYDVIFTGSFYTGGGFHKTRIEYVEEILNSNIDLKIFGNIESKSKIRQKKAFYYFFNFVNKIGLSGLIGKIKFFQKYMDYGKTPVKFYSDKFIKAINSPVFGKDMFELLSNSKICLNIHGEISKKCAGNIRLFEATGAGSCLLTDWKRNLSDLFEIDKEIVTYKSAGECIEKLRWLMTHPEEREKIAKAGQLRTIKDHNFENRISKINSIFEEHLNNK